MELVNFTVSLSLYHIYYKLITVFKNYQYNTCVFNDTLHSCHYIFRYRTFEVNVSNLRQESAKIGFPLAATCRTLVRKIQEMVPFLMTQQRDRSSVDSKYWTVRTDTYSYVLRDIGPSVCVQWNRRQLNDMQALGNEDNILRWSERYEGCDWDSDISFS
jgi:hypothetical protein